MSDIELVPHPTRENRKRNWLHVRQHGGALKTFGFLLAITMMMLMPAQANYATTYTRTALSVTMSGTFVTATTTIKASTTTNATLAGICARSSRGAIMDFPLSAATLTTSGTTISSSRPLGVGKYTYFACAKVNGVWNNIGAMDTFTVVDAPVPPPPSGGSGQAMPVGNLPGWTQVFTDDFTTPVAAGQFPGPYSAKWVAYNGFYDAYNVGYYDKRAISAHDGFLDLDLHTDNGHPVAAAPSPVVTTPWAGQTYGRFTVRFKSDSLPGYKAAWLLWPDGNDWNKGEIDFLEGGLDGTMWGFNHCINNPAINCYYINTQTTFTNWHTMTLEWYPGRLSYILDGHTFGTTTDSVPTNPMHWVLQTQSGATPPSATTAGHLLIDWAAVYTYTP